MRTADDKWNTEEYLDTGSNFVLQTKTQAPSRFLRIFFWGHSLYLF